MFSLPSTLLLPYRYPVVIEHIAAYLQNTLDWISGKS